MYSSTVAHLCRPKVITRSMMNTMMHKGARATSLHVTTIATIATITAATTILTILTTSTPPHTHHHQHHHHHQSLLLSCAHVHLTPATSTPPPQPHLTTTSPRAMSRVANRPNPPSACLYLTSVSLAALVRAARARARATMVSRNTWWVTWWVGARVEGWGWVCKRGVREGEKGAAGV